LLRNTQRQSSATEFGGYYIYKTASKSDVHVYLSPGTWFVLGS